MKRRVIIFEMPEKNLLGCISITDYGTNTLIRSYDSRCGIKDAQAVLPSSSAWEYIAGELGTTIGRGWRMVYDGEPNYG
jgi:hypothetical protein